MRTSSSMHADFAVKNGNKHTWGTYATGTKYTNDIKPWKLNPSTLYRPKNEDRTDIANSELGYNHSFIPSQGQNHQTSHWLNMGAVLKQSVYGFLINHNNLNSFWIYIIWEREYWWMRCDALWLCVWLQPLYGFLRFHPHRAKFGITVSHNIP